MTNTNNVDAAIARYLEAMNAAEASRAARLYPNIKPNVYTFEPSKKYGRVVSTTGGGLGSRSVHSFIDLKTGEMYRPASWKGPAKGVRANVCDVLPEGELVLGHGR